MATAPSFPYKASAEATVELAHLVAIEQELRCLSVRRAE